MVTHDVREVGRSVVLGYMWFPYQRVYGSTMSGSSLFISGSWIFTSFMVDEDILPLKLSRPLKIPSPRSLLEKCLSLKRFGEWDLSLCTRSSL